MTSQAVSGHNGHAGPSAEEVATAIRSCGSIGRACEALREAGWPSVIAGNRITLGDRVCVRFIGERHHGGEGAEAEWVVSEFGGGPSVRITSITSSSTQKSSTLRSTETGSD